MKNSGTVNITIELDRIVSLGSIDDPEKVFRIEWLLKSTGSPSLFYPRSTEHRCNAYTNLLWVVGFSKSTFSK